MMTPEQTAQSYDRIAEHWDNSAFNRQNGIAEHERALRFVSHRGSALDIGCGSSGRIIEWLLTHGFDVEGLDLSKQMLARARRHHPDVVFHHANVCVWNFPKSYDFISAWDSLWHVPLADQLNVLTRICGGLSPGGVLIFTTGGVEMPDERTNPCFGHPLYHAAPGIPALLRTLEAADCVCRHLEYDGPHHEGKELDKHVYLVAQRAGAPGATQEPTT